MWQFLTRVIKIVKNRASGFRTLEAFSDMIFLTVGDVDIPAQVPANFRAILNAAERRYWHDVTRQILIIS